MTQLQCHPVPRRRGFTLIEVMAVLILLGLLALGVMSILPSSNAALTTEADRLRSQLRYVQLRAQADVYQWRVVFTDATTYQIGPVVIPGSGYSPRVVPGTGETHGTLTGGVTTTAGTVVRFDSWGRPMNDSGNALLTHQVITLRDGERSESITIMAGTGLIP